jgi:multiple sugar transport system substrate-binding protein
VDEEEKMAKKQKIEIPAPLYDTTTKYLRRQISRREFLARTAAAGLSLPALSALLSACVAATPETVEVEKVVTVEVEKEVEKIVTVEVEKEAMPTSSAAIAEKVAKEKYAGETLNIAWPAGLQFNDILYFSGPEWERRTGVKVNAIEVADDLTAFSTILNEHVAGTGAYDVVDFWPNWIPDYALGGVLEPLDDFMQEYMNLEELEDFAPIYKGMTQFNGKYYGIHDDGDTMLIYYRTDLFEEHADEFSDMYGRPLAPPTNWKEFDEIAMFFTQKFAPDLYGADFPRGPLTNHYQFIPHFKSNGGLFFNPDTMDSTINSPEGVRTLNEMKASMQWFPEGAAQLGLTEPFFEWLAGHSAMTYFWPPLGRWSEGYGATTEALSWLPESQVKGVTGYALYPGDIIQHGGGHSLGVMATSPRKELGYLFVQWATSPEISIQRVTLPFALRDPYRQSHFESAYFRTLWPKAGEYLDTLLEAGEKGSLDLFIPGGAQYHEIMDKACTSVWAGTDPQAALDTAANEFDDLTERLGRDQQKTAYANYLTMKGAVPEPKLVDAPSNLELYE